MNRNKNITILVKIGLMYLLIFAGVHNSGIADVITLKDGNTLEGTISVQAADSIIVVVPGNGPLQVNRASIESIEKKAFEVEVFGRGNVEDVQLLSCSQYYTELRNAINNSEKSIQVAMYLVTLTDRTDTPVRQLLEDVVRAHKRGVEVTFVLESSDSEELNKFNNRAAEYLTSEGITVRIYPVYPIMHIKLVIIDDAISIMGSHNWTEMALRSNNESSALIKSPVIARKYQSYYRSLFHRAKPYTNR